jgi:hypothetical protein
MHVSKDAHMRRLERAVVMKDLQRILMSALMLCVLAACVFADPQRDQKREPPPKDPKVIRVEPKEKEPPPRNDNQQRDKPKDDRRRPPVF